MKYLILLCLLVNNAFGQVLTYQDPAIYTQSSQLPVVITNSLIPIMTSTNSPSGSITGSGWSAYSNSGGSGWGTDQNVINSFLYYAFDNDSSTVIAPANVQGSSAVVTYQFPTNVVANRVSLFGYGIFGALVLNVSASTDGSSYATLGAPIFTNSGGNPVIFVLTNSTPYKYYRFSLTNQAASGYSGVRDIQLYDH